MILEFVEKVFKFFMPPKFERGDDMDKWHWKVAISLFAIILFIAWSLSPYGFAPISAIEGRVTKLLTPMKDEVSGVKQSVGEINDKLTKVAKAQTDAQRISMQTKIIDYKEKFCKAKTAESVIMWKSLLMEYQSQCIDVFGEASPTCSPPACTEFK